MEGLVIVDVKLVIYGLANVCCNLITDIRREYMLLTVTRQFIIIIIIIIS